MLELAGLIADGILFSYLNWKMDALCKRRRITAKEFTMTDINWRHRDDNDFHYVLWRYYNHTILAETDVTFRIDNSSNFDPQTGKLISVDETLIRFAFID